MVAVHQVRLTGRAARFLQMMQDFGHLDEDGVTQVLMALGAPDPSQGVALADVDVVREVVAAVLFERQGEADLEGLLADDWPLLFS